MVLDIPSSHARRLLPSNVSTFAPNCYVLVAVSHAFPVEMGPKLPHSLHFFTFTSPLQTFAAPGSTPTKFCLGYKYIYPLRVLLVT